ncbi:MAG: hypothetical protein J7559_13880, partial [Cohnella sp.]|nr:hypothetical protein [Cohnella sp.]
MFHTTINYMKDSLTHPIVVIILRVFSIISIISSCITVGGYFIYTIGYAFLYGYFFSETEIRQVSLIDLLIKDIPFPFYSVLT